MDIFSDTLTCVLPSLNDLLLAQQQIYSKKQQYDIYQQDNCYSYQYIDVFVYIIFYSFAILYVFSCSYYDNWLFLPWYLAILSMKRGLWSPEEGLLSGSVRSGPVRSGPISKLCWRSFLSYVGAPNLHIYTYIYIYIYTFTHLHIYIYIYIYIWCQTLPQKCKLFFFDTFLDFLMSDPSPEV